MPTSTAEPRPAKPLDLFKPLYKRDKRLPSPEDSLDILDAGSAVAAAEASGGSTKVGPYTVKLQDYSLVHQPLHDLGSSDNNTLIVLRNTFNQVVGNSSGETALQDYQVPKILTVEGLPGLVIIPDFLPIQVQKTLVEDIIENLISDPAHLSNLDAHYINPQSSMRHLFDEQADDNSCFSEHALQPINTSIHAPLSLSTVRSKKLRWITLGGQYNWTTKVYPSFRKGEPGFSTFPASMAPLFSPPLFDLTPEAAIVNFYAPGDILSPHQDVAEISQADLVSMSIGCDAVFYIGLHRYDVLPPTSTTTTCTNSSGSSSNGPPASDDYDCSCTTEVKQPLQIRVRSGDVVIMGGASRAAFHGVGRVWSNSSPQELVSAVKPKYAEWLQNKRININVRQMLD